MKQTTIMWVSSLALTASLLASGGSGGGGVPVPGAGPELRVFDVTAPPGGVALIRIGLTTPMPIISGSADFAFDLGALESVAGVSLLGDYSTISGVAVRNAGQLKLRFTSTTGTLGTNPDLPVMIVKIPVSPSAKIGTKYKLFFNGLQLIGPNGAYLSTTKPGTFTVGGMSVNDADPRAGVVNPGQTITLKGTNFIRPVAIRSAGPGTANINVVDSQTLTFTAVDGFTMEGTGFILTNGDKSLDYFYSYRKGNVLVPSGVPLIAACDPIFASKTFAKGQLSNLNAIAIQNPGLAGTKIEIKVLDANSNVVAQAEAFLAPNEMLLRSIQELVPSAPAGFAGLVTVEGVSAPVQLLGLQADTASGSVIPVSASPIP